VHGLEAATWQLKACASDYAEISQTMSAQSRVTAQSILITLQLVSLLAFATSHTQVAVCDCRTQLAFKLNQNRPMDEIKMHLLPTHMWNSKPDAAALKDAWSQ
jgi:hypothetical protein